MKTVSFFFSTLFALAILTSCQKEDLTPRTGASGELSTSAPSGKPDNGSNPYTIGTSAKENWMLCDHQLVAEKGIRADGTPYLILWDTEGNPRFRALAISDEQVPEKVSESLKMNFPDYGTSAMWQTAWPDDTMFIFEFHTDAGDAAMIAVDGTLVCKGTH